MALPDGQKLCPTHNVQYGKLEQCSVCRSERSGAIVAGSPKADTSGARINAARYRLNEAACWCELQANTADDPNVAVKWSAESAKWARLAAETEQQLLEIEHDQWLIEQDRKRRGGS